MNCEDIQEQLSGYLDGELTQQQAQQVRVHLENCASCRQLHAELAQLARQVGRLGYAEQDAAELARLEDNLLSRTAVWSGWLLLLGGLLLAVGIALYEFFSTEIPWYQRALQIALVLGWLLLFGTVLVQRLRSYKNDKYRKVKL